MLDKSKCSKQLNMILSNKYGYRDNGAFGEGYTETLDVCMHEIFELGNLDILDFLYNNYSELFNKEEISLLESTKDESYFWEFYGETLDAEHRQIQMVSQILSKVIQDKNFCIWLCSSKDDVYDCYIEPFNSYPKEKMDDYIEKYEIPDDVVVLSDLEKEGCLVCF